MCYFHYQYWGCFRLSSLFLKVLILGTLAVALSSDTVELQCTGDGKSCVDSNSNLSDILAGFERDEFIRELTSRQDSPFRLQLMEDRRDESDLPKDSLWTVLQAEKLNHWKGIPFFKSPFEMTMYQQLLFEVNPRTIIELGTFAGGGANFLADQAYIITGYDVPVLTCDIDSSNLHPLAAANSNVKPFICDVTAYPTCTKFLDELSARSLARPWLVSEDAHFALDTQLEFWHSKLRPGDYIIIEDTSPDQNEWVAKRTGRSDQVVGEIRDKLRIVRDFASKYSGQYRVDSLFQDMYGYNGMKEWNSVLKRVA